MGLRSCRCAGSSYARDQTPRNLSQIATSRLAPCARLALNAHRYLRSLELHLMCFQPVKSPLVTYGCALDCCDRNRWGIPSHAG